MKKFLAAVIIFLVASPAVCAAGGAARQFVLPKHGRLEISVPASWKGTVTENVKGKLELPPTITFRVKGMEMDINPLWGSKTSGAARFGMSKDWGGGSNNSQTRVVEMLERDGNALLPKTVEKKLDLEEIAGDHCRGYYFSLTAAEVKPGEFRHLTRAGMAVGDLLISVSIMSDEKDSGAVKDAMKALKTMRQVR